ncbi:MAG: hypothetical protein MJE66_08435, partial [Proteobacteria bacterium]|nr:hypothetical protein [Pseudomonadota bacterium]
VGGSVYTGQSGQNQDDIPDTPITIWEVHSEYKGHGLSLRALWAQAHLQSTQQLSAAVGSSVANRSVGGYGEVAFDVLSLVPETKMSFEPFYRYEHLDTQDNLASGLVRNDNRDRDIHVIGFSFKPIPQVVIKFDYRNFDSEGEDLPDEVQAGFGYVF